MGRPLRQGRVNAKDNEYVFRRNLDSRPVGWFYGTSTHLATSSGRPTNEIWDTADQLYLVPLLPTSHRVEAKRFRVNLDTAVASGVARFALYVYNRNTQEVVKVPKSEAKIVTDTAGILTVDVDFDIEKDQVYLLGWASSTITTLQFACYSAAAAVEDSIGTKTLAGVTPATDPLPSKIKVTTLGTDNTDIEVPVVTYMNQDAETVF